MLSFSLPCYTVLLFMLIKLVFQPVTSNYVRRVDLALLEKIKERLENRQRGALQPSGYQWLDYGEDEEESDRGLELERVSTPLILSPRPCPGGERYCSRAEDYPEEYIRELLKKGTPGPISDFFSVDGGNHHPEDEDTDLVFDRFDYDIVGTNTIDIGHSAQEENLCPTRVMTKYPKKAHDKSGMMHFIVNQEEKRQAVVMEECLNKNNVEIECEIPGTLAASYKSYCKQKYSVRAMVTVDKGELRVHEFEFPSACCCVLVKNNN